MTTHTILLAEDSEDDVFLMKRALKAAKIVNPLRIVEDGQEAIDYLSGAGAYSDRAKYPYPDVVFLDIKMPRKTGFDVLKWIKDRKDLPVVPPVFVMSSSNQSQDLAMASRLGAKMYLVKPPDATLFDRLAQSFGIDWLRERSR